VYTLLIGLIAGALGTATYDTFRVAGLSARIVPMDEAFNFGQRLTGQVTAGAMHDTMKDNTGDQQKAAASSDPGKATLLGYLYHYWNGAMFAVAFLVLFGARRWWLSIPYMLLIVYTGMVLVMGVHSLGDFILEGIGHAAFGLTLGAVSWAYFRQLNTPESDILSRLSALAVH